MRSPISPSSSVSSSMIFGPITDDVLRAWSQLPETIRLDSRLAVFQRECDRIAEARWDKNASKSKTIPLTITDIPRSIDYVKKDCLVVNMRPHPVTRYVMSDDWFQGKCEHNCSCNNFAAIQIKFKQFRTRTSTRTGKIFTRRRSRSRFVVTWN